MDEKPQNYWHPDQQQEAEKNDTPAFSSAEQPQELTEGGDEVSWRASEYIHHDKGVLWYVVLGLVTIAGTGLAVFLQQWIFAALVLAMGVAIGVYASRPPREVEYRITEEGIYVADRLFPYINFRSFGVEADGAFYSLQLRPTKRFMPGLTIYFAEDDGEDIVDVLSEYLPMEELKPDMVDMFMRWLRF